MVDFINANLKHALCILILVSRIGDIGTTFLVTPSLALEANPIMRKLGWRFALLTPALCAMPYFSVNLAVMILVPSLMVSAANAGKIWVARTMGERRLSAMMLGLAARSTLRHALAPVFVSAFFIVLLGAVVVLLYPNPVGELAFWVGAGIITYGCALALHGSLAFIKLFKTAHAALETRGAGGAT
jgi:hypothetical protein